MSDPVVVRVGDRERQQVDDALRAALADGVLTLIEYDERAALCWGARTRTELDAVLADLPGAGVPAVPAQPGGPHRILAVMSESTLASPLVPGQPVTVTAVMGTAKLDLRREDLPAVVDVRATAVMGEVKVHVPPGTTVHLTGGAVMGERKAKLGPPVRGGSVVNVHATAVMGTVEVDDRPRKHGLLPAALAPLLGSRRSGQVAVPQQHVPQRAQRSGRGLGRRALSGALTLALAASGLYVGARVVTADQRSLFSSSEQTVQPADLDDGTYDAGVLFGSVTVVVPDGVRAQLSGTMVFGSSECDTVCSLTEGRLLLVRGTGAFGSIEVLTEAEAREGDSADDG